MSKLSKLINNPALFFKDMWRKRITGSLPSKPAVKATPVFLKTNMNILKPTYHLLYTGEGLNPGKTHLSLWIPIFFRSGEGFAILVRNMPLYEWVLKTYPSVDVIFAGKKSSDVETALKHLACLKAIYYPSNTGNLIHTLKFNCYKHIFLGHGDSDKSASAHKFFRVYDEIWVAGQAHIDRFKNADFDTAHMKYVKIGRPTLAPILRETTQDWDKRFSKPRVLYLPTWEGVSESSNYSSVRMSSLLISEISKKFGLSITAKLHPLTGDREGMLKNIAADISPILTQDQKSFRIIDKSTAVLDLLIDHNIFICDISAVVSECIAANSPLFVYIPQDRKIVLSQSNMQYSDYAYTFSNIDELCELLEKVLNGDDPLKEKRAKAQDYLLSVNETLNIEFFAQLKRAIRE